MYKLNDVQVLNILKLRKEGNNVSKISKILNIDNGTVKKYLELNGYSTSWSPSETEILDMIKFYNMGLSLNNLSNIFHYKGETISKYLKQNNIEIKKKICLNFKQKTNIIIELYLYGLSMQKIQDIICIERHDISKILKSNNINIRSNSEYRDFSLNQNYFDKIDTPNKAYILGFLYADGNVSKEKYNIQLSLKENDKEILDKIKLEIGSDAPLEYREFEKYNKGTKNQWCLFLHCKHMHESLMKYGIVPCKTHGIKYPDFLSKELHRHFIRGVLDGDGCIHTPYGSYNKIKNVDICGTYDFCCGAKDIIENELNVHCSIIKTSKDINRTTYRVTVSGGIQVPKFLDWIYDNADLKLERKYKIYLEYYCTNKKIA